jgi:zinc transporter 9
MSFNHPNLVAQYLREKDINMEKELQKIKTFESGRQLHEHYVQFGGGIIEQLGDEIDRIEDNIRRVTPEVKHVDLEVM